GRERQVGRSQPVAAGERAHGEGRDGGGPEESGTVHGIHVRFYGNSVRASACAAEATSAGEACSPTSPATTPNQRTRPPRVSMIAAATSTRAPSARVTYPAATGRIA